jgi:hypothetical protein
LAAQLWNASPSSTGDTLQSLDQIQHFACHCDTSSSTSSEYFLTLAHKEENDGTPSYREGHVAMNQLKEQFGGFRKRVSKKPLPLIFLNACGSSKMTPAGMASFPKFFLEYILGNRGVIGSEAIIPDVVAAEFSERFYRNLIRGHCLGEAMYRARWRLVRYLNNPLGILYAIYANPDLHVQITRAS